MQKHTCTTSADQTVLFSLLCVLVSGARFLLFLSVMQCMHFVLPFLYFRKDGTLSLCLWLMAIPTLNHSFISPALSNIWGKEYQLFQKCDAAFVACFFWVISVLKLFTYSESILGGERVVVWNHLHPFKS